MLRDIPPKHLLALMVAGYVPSAYVLDILQPPKLWQRELILALEIGECSLPGALAALGWE